jgi:hypothetical protein
MRLSPFTKKNKIKGEIILHFVILTGRVDGRMDGRVDGRLTLLLLRLT